MNQLAKRLRAALFGRGFTPIQHESQFDCFVGKTPNGSAIYIWLDRSGGGRYTLHNANRLISVRLPDTTKDLILKDKVSKLIAGGTA